MSLFINSKVHLPSSCEKCPFNLADMSVGICTAADKTIDTRTYGRKRHPDCPLVEIPTPHGRLIDCERATFPTEFRYNTNDYAKGWNACIKAVQTAPTIIEAEVSEE